MKLLERKFGCPYHIKEIEKIDFKTPSILSFPGLTGDDPKVANFMAKMAQVFMGRDCESPDDIRFLTVQYADVENVTFNGKMYSQKSPFDPVMWDVIRDYNKVGIAASPLSQVKQFVKKSVMPNLSSKNPKEDLQNLTFFNLSAGSMYMNMMVEELRNQLMSRKCPHDKIDEAINSIKFVSISPVVDINSIDKDLKGITIINRGDTIAQKAGVNNERFDEEDSDYSVVSLNGGNQLCVFTNEALLQEDRYTLEGEVYSPENEKHDPHDVENFFPVVDDKANFYLNSHIVNRALSNSVEASVQKTIIENAKDILKPTKQYHFEQGSPSFDKSITAIQTGVLIKKLGLD